MTWTPLTTILVSATVLGAGYLIFRKPKPKPKPKSTVVVTPAAPEGSPLHPLPGEQLAPGVGMAPHNWQNTFNKKVMATITEGRGRPYIRTDDDLMVFVCSTMFPTGQWPPPEPTPPWQNTVRRKLRSILRDLSGTAHWPLPESPDTIDAAITFWVSAPKALKHCKTKHTELESIRACAANLVFPDQTWPPPSGAPAWTREAWRRFG